MLPPSSRSNTRPCIAWYLLHPGLLLGLFNPEDLEVMILRNVNLLSTDYKVLFPRRQNSSLHQVRQTAYSFNSFSLFLAPNKWKVILSIEWSEQLHSDGAMISSVTSPSTAWITESDDTFQMCAIFCMPLSVPNEAGNISVLQSKNMKDVNYVLRLLHSVWSTVLPTFLMYIVPSSSTSKVFRLVCSFA